MKVERMAEEGTLNIVRRGYTYQVRYASDNPHEKDRQPYTCPDEVHLETLFHYYGMEPWAIHQAFAELQRGGMTVLRLVCSAQDVSRLFPLP
jgi:hypothetical protein